MLFYGSKLLLLKKMDDKYDFTLFFIFDKLKLFVNVFYIFLLDMPK